MPSGSNSPEAGISLQRLRDDLDALRAGFTSGKRRGVLIRGEGADEVYTAEFIESLLDHESDGLFHVGRAVLGPVQLGGAPSPFDRIQATRLTSTAVHHLITQCLDDLPVSAIVGLHECKVTFTPPAEFPELVEYGVRRRTSSTNECGARSAPDAASGAGVGDRPAGSRRGHQLGRR